MVDAALVRMFGLNVGTLRWNDNYAIAEFQYANDFVNSGLQPSPIHMPVRLGKVYRFTELNSGTFKGMPGMIADSLPDTYGRALFERWLSMSGRTSGTPIEFLCYLGRRCMGAMEFEPILHVSEERSQKFEIDSLVSVAREALDEKQNFGANFNDDKKRAVAEILRLGTSAGGQRAKAVIAYNKTTGEVLSGQVDAPKGFDYYLIKLDGVSQKAGFKETENFGRLEYSFYELVRRCGIDMMECMLVEENGRAHFLTKRFDRHDGKKVHMQTLCGIAHYDYALKRAYSYEQAFDVMRRIKLSYAQAQEMFKRMVLNVVIRNQDDHTKNISFLMDESGKWRLSPAYDIGYAYNPKGDWTSTHQMSVNGKFENINRKDLLVCADRNSIKGADGIIDEICEQASHWTEIAKNCGVPENIIEGIVPNMILNL